MAEKLCIFCKHFSFESGGHGEYADPTNAQCAKNKFNKNSRWGKGWQTVYDENDLRNILLNAVDCEDYERPALK